MPLVDEKLGGQMPLLGELRLFQRLALAFEIGAGILPIRVEEKAIEPLVEIIVPGDVAPGVLAIVALMEAAQRDARLVQQRDPTQPGIRTEVARSECEQVIEVAVRQFDAAVHVEFPERQFGIERQFALGGAVGDPDREPRPGPVAEDPHDAVAGLHLEMAVTDQSGQEKRKKLSHTLPRQNEPGRRKGQQAIEHWTKVYARNSGISIFLTGSSRDCAPRAALTPSLTRPAAAPISAALCPVARKRTQSPSFFALLSSPSPDMLGGFPQGV